MIVISPHLDDAVFSVGAFIGDNPGAVIATVFAGTPGTGVTPYEQSAGFASSMEAVISRIQEDHAAAEVLGATVRHGSFLDRPHRDQPIPLEILEGFLSAIMDGHDAILIPLGLHHPDHILVADLAKRAALCTGADVLVYEELPYAAQYPTQRNALTASFTSLAHEGSTTQAKRDAVACYRSQLNATSLSCLDQPERIWRLA